MVQKPQHHEKVSSVEFLSGSLSTSVQICWILTTLPLPCSQGLTTVYYQTVGFSLTR